MNVIAIRAVMLLACALAGSSAAFAQGGPERVRPDWAVPVSA